MKIEDQVCTQNQSIKLKELGVDQKSFFHYDQDIYMFRPSEAIQYTPSCKRNYKCSSAFNVAELSVMLLEYAETYFSKHTTWRISGTDKDYNTQAEASADRLIDLLENEILTVEEVNNRLTK